MRFTTHRNDPDWSLMADYATGMLQAASCHWPLWTRNWTAKEQADLFRSQLGDQIDQWILTELDDKTETISCMAVVAVDIDAHVGPCLSVMANWNCTRNPCGKFQRYLHRFLHTEAAARGMKVVCYTHMLPDGSGCVTKHIEVRT